MRHQLKQATLAVIFIAALAVGVVNAFAANTIPLPDLNPSILPPGRICTQYTVVAAGTRIDTSPSFGIDQKATVPERPLVTLLVANVDANSSVTTWQAACTVSTDANSTDYKMTSTQTVDGTTTIKKAGTFQIASPGSDNFVIEFDLKDMPDFECTITAAAGAAAAIDTLKVEARLCTRGD